MATLCKICQGRTHSLPLTKMGLHFHHCPSCDFIFKDASQIISQTEERAIYESHQNSIEDPRYVQYFQRFIAATVEPYCQGGQKGLDFGSGPSPVLATLLSRDYGYRMDIYDLFYAPEKSYLGKSYDLITCTEVVEHLSEPLAFFRLFRDLLKPRGILSLMTQYHPLAHDSFLQWHYLRELCHISFYTPQTLQVIGELVGLRVIFTDNRQYATMQLQEE